MYTINTPGGCTVTIFAPYDWNDYGKELDLFEYQKAYEGNK